MRQKIQIGTGQEVILKNESHTIGKLLINLREQWKSIKLEIKIYT